MLRGKPAEGLFVELSVATRPERSDALRNRERIMCTAERLFTERGAPNVSMGEIAEVAAVGKGTLYRRFGDRSGLAHALLEPEDVALQEGFLRGPPPLGPGAGAVERLVAFFEALSCFMGRKGELVLEAERLAAPGERFGGGAYAAHHTHVRGLLGELAPERDADVLAHLLLGLFRPELHGHLIGAAGRKRRLQAVRVVLDGLSGC